MDDTDYHILKGDHTELFNVAMYSLVFNFVISVLLIAHMITGGC